MKRIVALLFLFNSWSYAASDESQEMRFYFSEKYSRAHFSLGTEMASLSSKTASLMGVGPRAGFEYSMTDKWSLGSDVFFSFQATGKPGALFFSGVNGIIKYSFEGTGLKSTGTLTQQDGKVVYEIQKANPQRMTGFFGVDQLFLNGVSSIYPAVGMTAGASYGLRLFDHAAEFDIRYSSMLANDNPISMIAVGAQVNLDF